MRLLPLALFAAPVAAQAAPKPLQLIDLFRLPYMAQVGLEEPKGWIDADHYLVFPDAPDTPPEQRQWTAVAAASGRREAWLPRSPLLAALTAALGDGTDAGAIAAALDDADHYVWSHDHALAVIDVADDLFVSDREGRVVRLTSDARDEQGAQFAPDGSHVAFVAGGDLYVVPSAGGEVRALTRGGSDELLHGRLDWVYQEEVFGRGDWQGYWWSPDSRRIAVLQLDESPVQEFTLVPSSPARPELETVNYPKAGEDNPVARLGVVDVGGGEVRWFDTGKYPDQDRLIVRVTWTPDAQEVFLQVQNREQTWLDMLAGDAASGALRTVFHEASDCWVEPGPEPQWLDDGDFLWLSERDGRRHVYAYGRDGELRGQRTKGDWQVAKIVGIADDTLFFSADKESPLTQHLYSMPLGGGDVTAVTSGRGMHEFDAAPGCRSFLSTWSSTVVPHAIDLIDRSGQVLRQVAQGRAQLLRPFGLPEPEFVEVPARDGYRMQAFLLKPPGFAAGKRYPVLQAIYSGPHSPSVRDQWHGRDQLWHAMLAQHGVLVFGCDNRSASGRGRQDASACWRDLGGSELRDLEDSVQWLIAQGVADPARIGIWGWSYGGYQTLFNLTHSKLWQYGIAVNAVTDWRNYDTIYTERYLGLPTTNADGYASSSVVAAAKDLHGRLLLVAAALDDNVHMQNSLQLLAAMQQVGKDCDFMVYPGVRHGIEDLHQQLHLFARMTRFVLQAK